MIHCGEEGHRGGVHDRSRVVDDDHQDRPLDADEAGAGHFWTGDLGLGAEDCPTSYLLGLDAVVKVTLGDGSIEAANHKPQCVVTHMLYLGME